MNLTHAQKVISEGGGQHLAGGVVTNLPELALSFVTSRWAGFQNGVFQHKLSESGTSSRGKGGTVLISRSHLLELETHIVRKTLVK